MRPQRIGHLGLLPKQKIACSMLHQPALLPADFGRTNHIVGRRTASQIASASVPYGDSSPELAPSTTPQPDECTLQSPQWTSRGTGEQG